MVASGSAQKFVDIDTIREDIIVMKDGGLRVVLMCSSLNFGLKSADEQDAIIYQFQNFLNSLDFPIQVVIHSRHLNITPYLTELEELQKHQENELLRVQTSEYIDFIKSFISMTNVMTKSFYVVIPFTPPIAETQGIIGGVFSAIGFSKESQKLTEETFNEYKNQIWQRADAVVGGLQSFSVRAIPLNTEELIELFYGLYNPAEFEKELKENMTS